MKTRATRIYDRGLSASPNCEAVATTLSLALPSRTMLKAPRADRSTTVDPRRSGASVPPSNTAAHCSTG